MEPGDLYSIGSDSFLAIRNKDEPFQILTYLTDKCTFAILDTYIYKNPTIIGSKACIFKKIIMAKTGEVYYILLPREDEWTQRIINKIS